VTNGCGKFNDISGPVLQGLKDLGVTHLWLTGVLRQATLTDYSGAGLAADHADIVKGIAGSFYAVRDYYDVSPDYASAPERRMNEFEELLARVHALELKVLIDFVPNHVSRGYCSTVSPADTLGRDDDTTLFFSNQNNFFYLVQQPIRALKLTKPSSWNPPGIAFDGRFPLEDGAPGRPPKATGNNVVNSSPSATDWYETIKLNYGYNFQTRERIYDPQPRTWTDMDQILAYWQATGVDGFRCDFAHYIPQPAWTYLIARAKQRKAAYFVAEAYPWAGSGDPIESPGQLLDAGFDALYFYQSHNALKGIYTDGRVDEYDNELRSSSAVVRSHLVTYLENHDERRIASPIVRNEGPGASGFGSPEAGYQLAPLQLLCGSGPVLLLNGQEVGEPGAGVEGFSGEDGRTTIYDYWTMPEFAKWITELQGGRAALSSSQKALRKFYAAVLHLCQDASICGDGFWSLRYFNNPDRFADCPSDLYSYARFETGSGKALLIAANLHPGGSLNGQLRIPGELARAVDLPQSVRVKLVLDCSGKVDVSLGLSTPEQLAEIGFCVTLPNQNTQVYSLSV
jgi:glycosidase